MNGFIELKDSGDQNKRFGKQVNGLDSSVVLAVPTGVTYNYFVDVFGVGKFNGTATGGDSETINLGVDAGFVTVTGTIYDGSDNPKSGALVTFNNASTTVSAVADGNGVYSIDLKAGTYTVSESLAGHISPESASVEFAASTSSYDFGGLNPDQSALQIATWVVTGTIYASDGSTPMTDAYVWGTNASSTMVSSPVNSTDGTYSLGVTDGVWTIQAVGPKHIGTTLSPVVTVNGANQTGKNITLSAAEAGDNVPTSTTGIVTASTGGSLNDSSASGIKLTAGAGVLDTGSGDVTLNFEKSYSAPDTESFQALGNASFSIEASGNSTIKNLTGNAEIQLDYTDLLASLPAGVSESSLQLAYYSPERDEYVPVEGGFTVDPTNNTITGLVNHFTDFVITYINSGAGITVTESDGSTAVTEGGATDSITYVLTSQPTASVVITPSASGSKVSLSPTSMTFTTGNWATPQTLTVTAVDDSSVEGSHSDTITHVISSGDANYSGVSISNITATITDNDSSGGGGGGGSPADTTPPTNTSIVIASGATSTSGIAVNLTLGATGASQMMIGNDNAFTGGAWLTYATSKSWTLTAGAGTKTVYAKFRDTSGNISLSVSSTIQLLEGYSTTTPTTTVPEVEEQKTISCPLTMEKAYRHKTAKAIFYVTEDCTKRPFNKSNVFFTYFDSWDDVMVLDTMNLLNNIPNDKLGFMPWGHKYDPKYGALVKIVSDPKVYLLLGDKKYWITSEEVFNSLKYSWNWIEDVATKLLDKYASAGEITVTTYHPSYTLVKYKDSPKVYRLEPDTIDSAKQVKRYVKNETAFNALNFRWDRIVTIDDTEVYEVGDDLGAEQSSLKYTFTSLLEYGNASEEVKQLQIRLQELGYLDKDIKPTTYFGPKTKEAVIKLQTEHNLFPAEGYVGPGTRSVLNGN